MKICPSCQNLYADDVDACPKDGSDLLEASSARGRDAAPAPADRTSMIDLEAIEAKRKKRAARAAEPEGDEDADAEPEDDRTPPPAGPLEVDGDATGTLHRTAGARRRRPTLADPAPPLLESSEPSRLPSELRVITEHTARADRSRHGETQAKTKNGRGSTTRHERTQATQTRARTQRMAPPRKSLSGSQAALLVLLGTGALLAAIVLVARSTAVLTVTTVPPGAEVTLDGAVIGTSPLQKRVRTGTHAVELALDGYEPFKEVVDVPSGGLPFLQPMQKKAPPPPPPPTPAEIARELASAAAAALQGGDLDAAQRKIEEALRLMPNDPEVMALKTRVDAAVAERNRLLAQKEAAAARDARLQQARVLAAEGKRLYDENQLGKAQEKLYAALKLDPDFAEPHRTLARIFNRDDATDKVRYHLQRYMDLGGADSDFKVREWLKAHPRQGR